MKKYEITYLISDDVDDSEITRLTGKVSGIISVAKGKVLKEESFGRRKLAYPIDKKEFATYVTISFEIDPATINTISKDIRTMREIVRLITIAVEEKKSKTTLSSEDVADANKISDVIGGKKSFEAIEGQTEESYDLMAKRSDEDQTDKLKETDKTKETEEQKDEKTKELKSQRTDTENKKEEKDIEPKKKVVSKKTTKKAVEKKIKPKAKKTVEIPKVKKTEKATDEADRLSKLDKELDDLLGDDL